jgi:signal transduction histidine kinase
VESADGRALDHRLFATEGFPRLVMEKREPVLLTGEPLGDVPPEIDFGLAKTKVSWLLAQPIAVGTDSAGTLLLAGTEPIPPNLGDMVNDGARQLAVGLHNAWAHERLTQQSAILKEQGEILARANKVKTDFLASMSHELRTPLSAILGFADLLLSSSKETLSPRARESLERIKWNGDHLLGLINDVLDLAKVESGRIDVRRAPVNVSQLARACVAEVDSLRDGKELVLRADVPEATVEMSTDAQRVKQILLNLLANALKFTDSGEVLLTLRATADEVTISVRDTGIGISTQSLGELFQDFHQLQTGDGRRFPGTGVGLALSRRLARALGGDIEVRSREHEGSTFVFTLPRTLQDQMPPMLMSEISLLELPPASASSPLSASIIDDRKSNPGVPT